jgi:single-stranded DNA-binding protein
MMVLVEGEVDASAFVDKDGNARGSLDLTANTVRFLSRAGEGGGQPSAGGPPAEEGGFAGADDDLPF